MSVAEDSKVISVARAEAEEDEVEEGEDAQENEEI
jgi:hypothetical protein